MNNKQNTRNLIGALYIVIFLWFFWNLFYFFDLFSHFYLQYFFIGIFFLIFSIIIKDKKSIITSLIILLFLWFFIQKTNIIDDKFKWESDYYYLNANYNVQYPDKIIENIKYHNPKYVVIVELNKELQNKIKTELKFKNIIYYSDGLSSFWFFTNEIIENHEIHKLTYPIWEIKTKDWTIFIIHPFPPMNSELSIMQRKNFEEMKNLFKNNKNNKKIIIWDFNSSFYSQVFKKYFWGLYYKPVYSRLTTWILRLPIDYAIWNTDFFNVYWTDLNVSDHSPLLIKLKN